MEIESRVRVVGQGFRWFRAHAKPRRDAAGHVLQWCGLLEDIHERRINEDRLANLADRDGLTGLGNRLLVQDRLQNRSEARRFAIACPELHDFRDLTDTVGHAIGDLVLLEATRRIRSALRDCDQLAHGGEGEFLILLNAVGEDRAAVLPVLEAILQALRSPMQVDGCTVAVGPPIGAALPRLADDNATRLMQNADLALLRARSDASLECCSYSDAMDEKLRRTQALKCDLARAPELQRLFLVYQPLLETYTGRVRSLEALLRWRHPTRGLVSPADFVPEAESNGLIVPIGAWVIARAIREAQAWPADLRVAVNLSPVQVRSPGLVQMVADTLRETGLDPSRRILEITESLPLLGEQDNLATLHALRAPGIRIALDDFGSGYASLSYLQCFSFDMIKIERSLLERMFDSEEARTILRAVIRLSQSLCSVSVAGGVETMEQFATLSSEGCDCVQGSLFTRPLEASALPGVVAALDERARTGYWNGPRAALS